MSKEAVMDRYVVRQGDVLVTRVEAIPEGAVQVARDRGRVVLAYGEVTGHSHAIGERGAELLTVAGEADRWLRLRSTATLRHEEHAAITLPPGEYRVRIQREFSDADEPRQVMD